MPRVPSRGKDSYVNSVGKTRYQGEKKKLSLDLYIVHKYGLKIDKRLTYKTPRNQRGSLSFLSVGVKKSQNPGDKVASSPAGLQLLSPDDSQQMVPGEKKNGQFW